MSYSAKRSKRMLAGVLAAAMALTVTPILGFTGTAGAGHLATADPTGEGNVCEGAPEEDPFTDIGDNDPAVDEIRCMVNTDPQITQGKTATTYEPNSFVQRRQMALFLQRVADLAEAQETSEDAIQELPEDDGESAFTDIDDEEADQQQAIRRLEDSGVTEGVTATEFRPGDNVSRRQMAKFIVRLQNFLAGEDFDFPTVNDCEDCFNDDDGDSGEDELNILARQGVFIGTGGEENVHNVSPGDPITRRQMAFVLTRELEVLFEAGLISQLFDAGQVTLTSRSVEQGGTITGTITGDDIQSVTVSGCGLNNQTIGADEDTEQAGRQFTLNIPADQPAGACTLTFTITHTDGSTTTETERITVTERAGQATVTSRPELVSASIVQTTTQGTTVRYIFDEALTGASVTGNAADFHVYTFGSDGTDAIDATSAVVDSGNTRSVLATFPITTASAAAQLSLATVDFDAVRGLEGTQADGNTIGDAPLNQGTTTQLQARRTAGPDLLTVGNLRANPAEATETLVDFTFDEAAFNNITTGYNLVLTDGTTELDCTVVSGDGTATHSVACPNNPPGSTTAISAANVARGYVESGTVDDVSGAGGNTNPLQAADVSGASETPDLVSAEIRRDVNLGGGTIRDQILYTFDEPVLVGPGGNAAYRAYLSNGAELFGQPSPAPTRSTTNDTQVLVTFGTTQDALDLAVGASVDDAAVTEGTGTQNRPNQEDEVGVSNVGTGPTTTSGRTAAPDLTDVSIERITDAFGATTGARVRYTFDEDVVVVAPGNFFIVLSDGTRYACDQTTPAAPAAGTTEETDNQVTCTSFGTATTTQILSAVLGTVDDGAVANQAANTGPGTTATATAGAERNPEGAEVATGTTGTPQQ